MAKKVNAEFNASLTKNDVKGGAWLANISTNDEGVAELRDLRTTAWANASAGKRWVKEQVQALTPKKSVKMIAGEKLDAKGKPIAWRGVVKYKREA
jgi:hypothetical protein